MTEKERLLHKISMYAFACRDCSLFLDSHPKDKEAIEYFDKCNNLVKKYKEEYVEKYGPISISDLTSKNEWKWATGDWPWEVGR